MPIHNEDIAKVFDEMADLLDIENANPFRVRAYRNAARNIRGMGHELEQMLANGSDLTKLPGIGTSLAAKIEEIVASGHVKALDQLHKEVPASLEDLLHIPGLGPKRVRALYQDLNIKTLKQLEHAARQGQLQQLPGFGAKTEQRILETIQTHPESDKRFLHHTAHHYADPLVAYLSKVPGVLQVVVAGSYRRGQETVGDLDILVTAKGDSPVMQKFTDYDEVTEVVSKGGTRATVFLRSGLQVDLRVVALESFGAALHYFTGNKAHNIQIRKLAQQRGLKINEYGVFKGDKRISGKTEASIFKAVGLPYIPPELRNGSDEIKAAQQHKLPKLIMDEDLQGDLHVHTKASDGHASIEEMAQAARQRGLKYIAITDHSPSLTVAHGIDENRLQQQLEAIDKLNEKFSDFKILKGSEVDILDDGRLDYHDSILSQLDIVVAAVHSKFQLSRAKQTTRILRAMDSKYISILAHPSGRLLGERDAYDVDMSRIITAASERGCFLELNSQPQRLDLNDTYCQQAKQQGVLVCINSDAHGPADFDYLSGGIHQARRGWLEKKDVLNSRPLSQVMKLLNATRQ
jgi:DNA polymerase (family 10)